MQVGNEQMQPDADWGQGQDLGNNQQGQGSENAAWVQPQRCEGQPACL